MSFSAPVFLLLFLLAPALVWLGWPGRSAARRREIASLILRLIIFSALVLSLAGLELVRSADNLAVVFLVDVSDSMPDESKTAAVGWVADAIAELRPDDKAAIVLFGGDALVERPMLSTREITAFTSVPTTTQTDFAQAIRLALALFPSQAAKRIIILSDGVATTGNAEEAARLAAAAGVQIDVVVFARETSEEFNEALLLDVSAPSALRHNEQFDLSVTIDSTVARQVGVRVFANSELVHEGTVDLIVGRQSYPLSLTAGEPGFVSYRVQIVPPAAADTYYQNNELAAFSQIKGPPRVLLVTGENAEGTDSAQQLANALRAADIHLDRVSPGALPSELSALANYASVVLVDVPARDLSHRQQSAVEQYVRDLGGGLLVIGGPQSYGVGGYFRTPLEDVLPVDMQLKDEKRRPRLAIVFIIDHSGSMAETSGGVQKIELAKEAAIRAIELLSPTDKVGVIQFDDSAGWVVPITTLDDPDSVINRVASIRASGGTDILSGVQAMASELPQDDSQLKHVILLTDGGANPAGIPELVRQLYEQHGITLSGVAVGRDAATDLLQQLADVGGGRYHFADNPATIPEIFTEETTLATRAYIIEEPFTLEQLVYSPILQGITEAPPLRGYVGTTAKSTAQLILVSRLASDASDPILAAWQYGLGRAVAWTSDATGRWAVDWLNWEGYPTMFAQAVRYTINESVQSDITADVTLDGEQATLAIDAFDNNGEFINGLKLNANIIAPDGTTIPATLAQTAPGRYEAQFTPTEPGAYIIRVNSPDGAAVAVAQTTGWVLSYSPEYKTLAADPSLLTRVAGQTGGKPLAEASESVAHTLPARRTTSPLHPQLLLLSVLLLPIDIAVRRLVISRFDAQRAAQQITQWAQTFVQPGTRKEDRVESMSRLMQAKQRASTTRLESGAPPPTAERAAAPPPKEPPVPADPKPPPQPKPPAEAGSTAAALLAKKRRRP